MSKMPIPIHDMLARALATEAILGVLAKGEDLSQESVHDWLEVSLKGHSAASNIMPRAMYFAVRVIDGPTPFDANNFGVWTSAQVKES